MKVVRVETLPPGTELRLAGFLIDGPHGSALVHAAPLIEPKIAALCANNGDDPDDYTATELFALSIRGPIFQAGDDRPRIPPEATQDPQP